MTEREHSWCMHYLAWEDGEVSHCSASECTLQLQEGGDLSEKQSTLWRARLVISLENILGRDKALPTGLQNFACWYRAAGTEEIVCSGQFNKGPSSPHSLYFYIEDAPIPLTLEIGKCSSSITCFPDLTFFPSAETDYKPPQVVMLISGKANVVFFICNILDLKCIHMVLTAIHTLKK